MKIDRWRTLTEPYKYVLEFTRYEQHQKVSCDFASSTFVSFVTATVLPSILLLQTISPHLVSCIIVYNIHFPESNSNIPSQTSAIVPTPSIPHCSADGLPLLLSGLPLFLKHWYSPHLHSAALADETPLLGFERPSFMHGLRVISLSTFP